MLTFGAIIKIIEDDLTDEVYQKTNKKNDTFLSFFIYCKSYNRCEYNVDNIWERYYKATLF